MLRIILLGLSFATSAVLVLAGGTLAYAQTQTAKSQILSLVETALSDEDNDAEAEELTGFLPFNFEVGRVRLSDDDGTWFELDRLHARLSPGELVRGRLRVIEAGADRLALHRIPDTFPALPAPDEPQPVEPLRLPERIALPPIPPIAVDHLEISRIEIGEPVLGEAAAFNLQGRVDVDEEAETLAARLDLARIDEDTARLALDARISAPDETMALMLEAEETGGLMARLTGQPEVGDLHLRLAGEGPLGAFQADLAAEIENLARIDGTLALALAERLGVDLQLAVLPGDAFLPDEMRALVGERIDLALRLDQTGPQELTLVDLRLISAIATLTGDGRIDLGDEDVDLRLALHLDELAPLEALAATPLAGSLRADVTAAGDLTQPEITLGLTGHDLMAADLAIESLGAEFRVALLDGVGGARVSGEGRADGLALIDGPALPEDSLAFALDATALGEDEFRLDHLEVTGAAIRLAADGHFDVDAMLGEGRLNLELLDLAVLTAALGPELTGGLELGGAANLAADLRLTEAGDEVTGVVTGGATGLSGLPPGAAELLGPDPTLEAGLVFRPEERAHLHDLRITGAGVALDGDVALDLTDDSVDGRVALTLPELGLLAGAVGPELAGTLRADAVLGGTLARPEIRLDAQGDDLRVGEETFENVALTARAAGAPDDLAGDVALAIDHQGERLALDADYRLAGERLAIADLRLSAPETLITGDLDADLAGPLVDGRLEGVVGDLAALRPWHQQELEGRVALSAMLDAVGTRQDARLDLDIAEVVGDFGTIGAVDVAATVEDAFGAMRLDARGQVRDFRDGGDIHVARLDFAATGDLAGLDVTADAEGRYVDPFDLNARAHLALAEEPRVVRLHELAGHIGGETLELESPATLVIDGDTVRLDQLDIRFGRGELRTQLLLEPGRVQAGADLVGLPLSQLAAFGLADVEGELRGTLRLAGTPAEPTLDLVLAIDDLTTFDPGFEAVPPADLVVEARVAGGRLDARFALSELVERPVSASLRAPVRFRLDPFLVELPEDGAIEGRLDAEARLARLVVLAGLDLQRIDGLMNAALSVDGTVADPRVRGTLTIEDGIYEHGDTGTVLRDVRVRVRGTEQALVIDHIYATDGGSGWLNATGEVGLDPDLSFPLQGEIELRRANLVRRGDADATVSGMLELSGSLADALLAGRIEVDVAEFEIPENGGPRVVVIDVEEVGLINGQEPPTRPRREPMALRLDIVVDMPARVFVRGRGLDSEWRGRLEVQGPADAPLVLGDLEVVRGHFDLLDRRFVLRESTIEFDGAQPPMPLIDVSADTQTADMRAIVRVVGRAPDIELDLDSEPSLPQDEIVARILFDRDLGQITPGQAVRLAAAVRTLTGGGSGIDVVGSLRSATGLAVLDIGGDSLEEGTVRAGTYLADEVYLEVERGITSGSSRARVEYEITPRLRAETEVSDGTSGGVGIKWRYDY